MARNPVDDIVRMLGAACGEMTRYPTEPNVLASVILHTAVALHRLMDMPGAERGISEAIVYVDAIKAKLDKAGAK